MVPCLVCHGNAVGEGDLSQVLTSPIPGCRLSVVKQQCRWIIFYFGDTWAIYLLTVHSQGSLVGYESEVWPSPPSLASPQGSQCPGWDDRRPSPYLGLEGHSVLGRLCLGLGLLPRVLTVALELTGAPA